MPLSSHTISLNNSFERLFLDLSPAFLNPCEDAKIYRDITFASCFESVDPTLLSSLQWGTMKYQYQPLPEDGLQYIRIATIQPGNFDEDIQITLRHVLFRSDPHYEALSYVWGPHEENPARIAIEHERDNSSPQRGWLPARANLASALHHLRRRDGSRDVWIDAVCINQDDEVTKGAQVALMGAIFARATRVLIWLGPENNGSGRAIEILQDLGEQVDVNWDDYAFLPARCPRGQTLIDMDVELPCDDDGMCAIYLLFCRDWFDRLWVRQEIFLAEQDAAIIICGNITIPWKLFRSAWLLIRRKQWVSFRFAQELHDRLNSLNGFLHQYQEASLHCLWEDFGEAKCTDLRDRIYAVRGLLTGGIQEAIEPDYTKSVVDVYRDAVLAYINHTGNLDILGECQWSDQWNPSWVPNWSFRDYHINPLDLRMASGMLKTPWEVMSWGVLRVASVVVTRLADVKPLLHLTHKNIPQTINALFLEEPRSLTEPYATGGSLLDAYTRTLCNDVFADNHDTPTGYRFPSYEVAKRSLSLFEAPELEQDPNDTPEFTKLVIRISYVCNGRSFFRTSDGLVGIASRSAKQGDEICAVLGCRKLLLLRPVGDARYRVLSECYLSGFSHGEALLGLLPQNIQPIWTQLDSGAYAEVFEDVTTGERRREDPRLQSLRADLGEYRDKLNKDTRPYLELDLDMLIDRLKTRKVLIQTIDLV